MTASAPISTTGPAGRTAKIARFAGHLLRCPKAATISEYGLGVMLLVAAASAAHSPRLHAVKDGSCEAPAAGCFREHAAMQSVKAVKAKAPPPQRTAAETPARAPKPTSAVEPKG